MIGNNGPDDLALKALHKVSGQLHWQIAPRYYSWRSKREIEQYDSSSDMFEIYYIDPGEIVEVTRREVPFFDNRWNLLGLIEDGDWDRRDSFVFSENYAKKEWFRTVFQSIRFDDCLFYQSLRSRVESGTPWFKTAFVQAALDFIDRGIPVWHGCHSEQDVRDRCKYVDKLYHKISTHGYKTQQTLGKDFKSAMEQEVMIDLSRDGTPLFVDGRHRLAIAKMLDLEAIPVVIGVRHSRLFEG